MKTRVITAIVALAVFAGVLIAPPIAFTIALAAVTIIMLFECYRATKADTAMKIAGIVSAVLMMITMYVMMREDFTVFFVYMAATIVILLHMALAVVEHGKNYKEILSNGFLTLYITVSMWCILFAREHFGTTLMLLIFVCAWSTDTFAYFSGRLFGKHKLIPHVSPNKTVEGAIGGIIGSIICCFLYLCISAVVDGASIKGILGLIVSPALNAAIIGGIGGIWSQVGDLVASSIKRDNDIKDFGWIFPGHGGFMDRFDSVLFISPIILMLLIGSL